MRNDIPVCGKARIMFTSGLTGEVPSPLRKRDVCSNECCVHTCLVADMMDRSLSWMSIKEHRSEGSLFSCIWMLFPRCACESERGSERSLSPPNSAIGECAFGAFVLKSLGGQRTMWSSM